MAQIAFIGLGNMGLPMAQNLLAAGHQLSVFDLVPAAIEKAVSAGAQAADSAAVAVKDAEFVISMLPAGLHVEDLYLGSDGVLASIQTGTQLVDCSTIAPETARRVSEAAESQGFDMLDAPVSGGVGGAQAGTLTFMVGGSNSGLEHTRPLLEVMGKNIFHAGGSGTGQVAKCCNNMLLGIQMIGTSEAINLGIANGLDPAVLSEIMQQSSGGNWTLNVYNPHPGIMENVPSTNDYQGGFGVDLMLKDLKLAAESALNNNVATPLGSLAKNLYNLHSKSGSGKLDFSSIIQLLKSPGS
ncbi:MAG: 3-hydroxyisobutyrate dehydrogenase [Gammaproteobacteria bacterium]|nr:3-hydroxyisobutyrate dehydrogenase [Gammaproteobacteria bacterium]